MRIYIHVHLGGKEFHVQTNNKRRPHFFIARAFRCKHAGLLKKDMILLYNGHGLAYNSYGLAYKAIVSK